MVHDAIRFEYGDVEVVEQPEGFELYYSRICIGGKDDEGEFLLVQDGPAQGEKAYL